VVPLLGDERATLILILILCLVLPNLALPIVTATEDSWAIMEPMPTARAGMGVAVVDGKIYAIGGHNWGNTSGINEMYDPETDTWTTKTPMPTPRTNFGIAVVENKIYAIGGSPDDWVYTDVNEVYDPAIDTWETKTSMPTARHALEANVVDGKIYMITDSLNQIYDPQTDTWRNGASPPSSVDKPAAGVTAGDTATKRVFVMGGQQGLDAVNLNQVYDPETDTWVAGLWLPTARFGLGVAVVNDMLYAIGGHTGWFGTPISAANERYTPADFVPEFPSWIILPLFVTATLAKSQILPKKIDENSNFTS
jgi:hypothetical protein